MRLGFRRIEIDRDILRINGNQVIFRGMNRHETHPIRGRMFDEQYASADLIMMKQSRRQRHPDQPLSPSSART